MPNNPTEYCEMNSRKDLQIKIEKETVDEIIFRTSKPRNRLMLELMARGGMVK
jgi:hypothetical protein